MKNLKLLLTILLLTLLFTANNIFGQATLEWAKSYSFPGNNPQHANDVVCDTNGNIYMTGFHGRGFSSGDMVTVKYNSAGVYQWGRTYNLSPDYTGEWGTSIATYRNGTKSYIYAGGEVNYSGLTQFIKIIKYDENGNVKWEKEYDPNVPGVNDNLTKLISDHSGNCYITGATTTQAYLAKYDSSGNLIFANLIPKPSGYSYTYTNDMTLDAAGNIYVIGTSDTNTAKNWFIVKYNTTGILQWSKLFKAGPTSQNTPKSIKAGPSGNIYVTGTLHGATFDFLTIKYNASTGDTIWIRKYNGTANAGDEGRLLVIDASENIYVSGITNAAFNFDIATIKYNSSGVQQWVKTFVGPGGYPDDPKDLIIDASGNIYLAFILDNSYGGKYGLLKYDNNGNVMWSKDYDVAVTEYDSPNAMTFDNSGNVVVAGSSGNDGDFGILKYNTSGSLLWMRKFYGAQITNDRGNGVVTDKNGNAYIVGKGKGGQGDNIFVIKYNSAGVRQWVYNRGGVTIAGYDAYDEGMAIAVDTSGNTYITGTTYAHPVSKNEMFAGKIDSNGNNVWFIVENFSGPPYGNDQGNDIAVDAAGNVYVAGEYGNTVSGNADFIIIKYNNAGAKQWSRAYGGSANLNDKLKDLEIDAAGNVYVTGTTINSGTNGDVTTIKYSTLGAQQWVNTFNGTANNNDTGNVVKADNQGNVYVCGSEVSSAKGSNSILIKYNSAGTQLWNKVYSSVDSSGDIDGERASALGITSNDSIIYIAGTGPIDDWGYYPSTYYHISYKSDGTYITGTHNLYEDAIITGSTMDQLDNFYIAGSRTNGPNGYDNFVVKIGYNDFWDITYNGPSGLDDFSGNKNPVAVAKSGAVFIAGSTYDTITGNTINLIKFKQPLYETGVFAFIEGRYYPNGESINPDTIMVYLRNSTAPYGIVDSAKGNLDLNGDGYFKFFNVTNGSYYIVAKHRNSLETWSNQPKTFGSGYMYHIFKNDSSSAYGNNLKGITGAFSRKYVMYSGDVNYDGTIDVGDIIPIFNDMNNFVSGYVQTDITGDDFVDVSDLLMTFNNSNALVSVIRP